MARDVIKNNPPEFAKGGCRSAQAMQLDRCEQDCHLFIWLLDANNKAYAGGGLRVDQAMEWASMIIDQWGSKQ